MQVVILCSSEQKSELMSGTAEPAAELIWIDEPEQFSVFTSADCLIDLLFEPTAARIAVLSAMTTAVVVVSSVQQTSAQLGGSFVRINGWSTFLSSTVIEAAGLDANQRSVAEQAFSLLGKKLEWVGDLPGFITPRIICSIINEAYFALEDGVSTKAEIDVAMKLGTAYPYGPFDWAQRIGLEKVVSLLQQLAMEQPRYAPCPLLRRDAHTAS